MEFTVQAGLHPAHATADALIVALGSTGLTASGQALDASTGGVLSNAVRLAGFEGKLGQTLPLYQLPHVSAPLVLIVGAGNLQELDGRGLQKLTTAALKALPANARTAVSYLTDLQITDRNPQDALSDMVRTALEAGYRFDQYKSKRNDNPGLSKLVLAVDASALTEAELAVHWGQALAAGTQFARDLGNQPPNVCHPSYLAEQAKTLVKGQRRMKLEVLGEKEIEALGMGAFMAVSRGSAQEGKLIVIEYKGGSKNDKPVVLVGKGITFDTGGISLKPGAAMDEMKYDMCGAASVLGVMRALADSKLPVNVVGVVAAAENMPSGNATRPGDIVTTMSGQTVEILNTDAEGRLVLCDTLTYIRRYDPAVVIDIATLTGACVVALGKIVSGLFTPDDTLANDLLAAGQAANDRTWRMPLLADYQEQIDSPFADIANISNAGPNGGAITAACFLQRFTKDYTWAHLDIAGVAWVSGAQKGATGRPVPLLLQYLRNRATR